MIDNLDDLFQDSPNHELYGFGTLAIGDICEVDLKAHDKTAKEIQAFVHAYGQYTKKKFKTKALNGVLYIKRVR